MKGTLFCIYCNEREKDKGYTRLLIFSHRTFFVYFYGKTQMRKNIVKQMYEIMINSDVRFRRQWRHA